MKHPVYTAYEATGICFSGRHSPDVWITTSAIAIATSLGLVVF